MLGWETGDISRQPSSLPSESRMLSKLKLNHNPKSIFQG